MSYLRERIFIIDGDKDASALVKAFLQSQGYQVTVVSDPLEKITDSIPDDDASLYNQ